jgi:hypothetical protein
MGRGRGVEIMEDALRMVTDGACSAWPLPADPTCAGIARRIFRRAAEELRLDSALADDGVTMVSELAANTLHAHRAAPETGQELWLYLRGAGPRRELVCKVFDSYPGWLGTPDPGSSRRVPLEAMSGRGLEVVHEFSGGRWGYHLTRSRLSGWPVRGKAVWFAVPAGIVPASRTAGESGADYPANAAEAARALEDALASRGFGGEMVRAEDQLADMAVLSVTSGLTVWCRAGVVWLRTPGAGTVRWGYADLVEVEERAVEACETLADGAAGAVSPADVTRTGA